MVDELSLEASKELLALCVSGRLYAVEAWVQAGRSLQVPRTLRKTPLHVAFETGFHSLVELLLRHAPNQQVKNEALQEAVQRRQPDLVDLALAYGAEIDSVPFVNVLETADKRIVTMFIERGADPITNFPFARALHRLRAKTTLGTYLDFKRKYPELEDQLQEQANVALRQFCRDDNLKWVSLLIWAGADPRSSGLLLEYIDHPDMVTTAFHEACMWGQPAILKRLKPDPVRDDLSQLLEDAAYFARRDTIAYLLTLGANPNNKPDGGSGALDTCIRHLGWADGRWILHRHAPDYKAPAHSVSRTRDAIRLLVEHGAVWKPDTAALNDTRRIVLKVEPSVTVELAGLLASHHACAETLLHEFVRTPRMQQHLATCEHQMARVGLTLDGRRIAESQQVRSRKPSAYVLARYDRKRLYEEVWSEPTQKVAARYGVSDVALTKVCWQLQIPKPPRGYWAKKAARQPVPRRPKLPTLKV